jgi:hypothetical protein
MRHLACIVLLGPIVGLLAPAPAGADKKADKQAAEEYSNINPPAPYKLFVTNAPNKKFGTDPIVKVFSEKNAKKNWRPMYDKWFTLVPSREAAEITIDVTDRGFVEKPRYQTVYFIVGRLTITGVIKDVEIRGDDTSTTFGSPEPGLDLLRRIVKFMRDNHKAAVLAHTGATASLLP